MGAFVDRYELTISRDLRLVGYSPRLKAMRWLKSTIVKHGLKHENFYDAEMAAIAISKSPIVVRVAINHVREKLIGVYRNGEEHNS